MLPAPKSVGTRMSRPDVLQALRTSRGPGLPVLTEHGEYVGVVTAVGAAAAVGDGVPVLDAEGIVVGWLRRDAVLRP